MDPLLKEVVGKGEAEEDTALQCAIVASLSQQAAALTEPEPEPEPENEQDTVLQLPTAKDQKTEQEGDSGCVAAGFVEVVMDSDE